MAAGGWLFRGPVVKIDGCEELNLGLLESEQRGGVQGIDGLIVGWFDSMESGVYGLCFYGAFLAFVGGFSRFIRVDS